MVHCNKLHEEWPLARYLLLHAAWSTIWQTLSTVQDRLMSGNCRRLYQDILFIHLTLLISWKLHVVIIVLLKKWVYVSEIMPQGILRSECGGTRWRTGGEVKGKLANGVGSHYSHTTSEGGVSTITNTDAYTSTASSRLNWLPRRFKWTRPFRRKTKCGFCACAIRFRTSCINVSESKQQFYLAYCDLWLFQAGGPSYPLAPVLLPVAFCETPTWNYRI